MSGSSPVGRFTEAFEAHRRQPLPGVIPYFTAGYPRLRDTVDLLLAAERVGCLAAEVGVPFSDPLADGPTIQRAGWQALRQGMTLPRALAQIAESRRSGLRLPVAVMTYVNPVLALGLQRFADEARDSGADGVIVPDLPADEAVDLRETLHTRGLALIPLVAPTTPAERLGRIVAGARAFVYCVGVTGVTGAREALAPEALRLLDDVRCLTRLPRALGFGISRPAHLAALAGRAEAAVIGSALLDAIGQRPDDPAAAAGEFLGSLLLRAAEPGAGR